MSDAVNHPAHYTQGDIECIDVIEAMLTPEEFVGHCRGCAIKYLWRFHDKGGVEDLEKATWYLNRMIGKLKGPMQKATWRCDRDDPTIDDGR